MTEGTNDSVSVLVDRAAYLTLLDEQTARNVELITWNDDEWTQEAERVAARHSWRLVRASNKGDALNRATGDYVVGWSVQVAEIDALNGLVEAAIREPDKRGAVAANFDPVILWRRDEFGGHTGRAGLAAAPVQAMTDVGPEVHPS